MKPYLANLFAYRSPDPKDLLRVETATKGSGDFKSIWRPVEGWVAAAAPLPLNPPLPQLPGSILVAELSGGGSAWPTQKLDRLISEAPEKLSQVPGEFGLIHLHSEGDPTAVRSCGGIVPFYFFHCEGVTALGTRLEDFVVFLRRAPELDPFINALWLSSASFPQGRSFLKQVRSVPRGHYARIGPERVTVAPYWDPVVASVKPLPAAERDDKARQLRRIVTENINEGLDDKGLNLLSLSGGVDSGTIAILAKKDHRMASISAVPTRSDLAVSAKAHLQALTGGFEKIWSYDFEQLMFARCASDGPPVLFQVPHPVLLWLPELAAQTQISTLVGGEFADWLCGSYLTRGDWFDCTGMVGLGLAAIAGRLPLGPRDAPAWLRHHWRKARGRRRILHAGLLPHFVRDEIQEEFAQWLSDERAAAGSLPAGRRDFARGARADGFVAMNWAVCSRLGIKRCFPFFSRELLEIAYGLHPRDLVGPGPKKLLRQAFSGYVPHQVLNREKFRGQGASPLRFDWRQDLPERLGAVLKPDWFPRPPADQSIYEAQALAQLVRIATSYASFWNKRPEEFKIG